MTARACDCSFVEVRMLKAEVVEAPLYGSVVWIPSKVHYDNLRLVHRSTLPRCISCRKRKHDGRTLSYADALVKADSEGIEATVRRRRIRFASFLRCIGEDHLPMFARLVGVKGCTGQERVPKGRFTEFGIRFRKMARSSTEGRHICVAHTSR